MRNLNNKIQKLPSPRLDLVASDSFSSYKKEGLDPAKFKRSKNPEPMEQPYQKKQY